MLDYERFKEIVSEQFMNYMPEEYQNMKLVIQPVEKVNLTKDGLSLYNLESGQNHVAPTIYLNDMYEQYIRSEDLDFVLKSVGKVVVDAFEHSDDVMPKDVWENTNDKIFFQLINTEKNRAFLDNVPHREYQDLSVIYRWMVEMDESGSKSSIVNNSLAEKFGLKEEELFTLATKNTREQLKPYIKSMNEVMREIMEKDHMDEALIEEMLPAESEERSMYVIGNKYQMYGATGILYDDLLQEAATLMQGNFYILPSSIQECLVVPEYLMSPKELTEMVREVNASEVREEDQLSDNVYFYDSKQHEWTVVNVKEALMDKITDANKLHDSMSGLERQLGQEPNFNR